MEGYSDTNEHKEYFYNKYSNEITEIYLTSDTHIDVSKFKKLKKLIVPNNTSFVDKDLEHLRGIHSLNICGNKISDSGLQWLQGIHSFTRTLFSNEKY
jgi:hypothetical protein